MSNFAGVTFPYQRPTSSDHAIVNRAALTDGFLSGCTITFAGTGLTMDAGHLILCGRHVRHTAIETWTVDGASSGYARLILAIDTTKTSTLDAFAQVEASVDYADAAEGFPALTQSDINADGVLYQTAACIVSLGSGGITGIVQQLPAASARGGGGLNFKVVGGTAQPADPVENMIWVNTDVEITDVVISNAPPLEHQTGTVWIKTGSSSYGQLNIAAAGTAMVYPLECWIYADASASPAQAEAMTYRYGKWRDWGVYLYREDYENPVMGGGWMLARNSSSGYTISQSEDGISIVFSDDDGIGQFALALTKSKVSLSGISALTFNPDVFVDNDDYFSVSVLISNYDLTDYTGALDWIQERILATIGLKGDGRGSNVLDVSGYDGSYYVGVLSQISAVSQKRAEALLKWIKME